MKVEQGFTMVELLVALAMTALVVAVAGAAISQMVTVPEYGNEKTTALHELQNVAHWLNVDGQMSISAVGGGSLTLTLSDNTTINYLLQGTDLIRQSATSNRTLAQNISGVGYSVGGSVITMTIASSPDGRWSISENATYQVSMRPVAQ